MPHAWVVIGGEYHITHDNFEANYRLIDPGKEFDSPEETDITPGLYLVRINRAIINEDDDWVYKVRMTVVNPETGTLFGPYTFPTLDTQRWQEYSTFGTPITRLGDTLFRLSGPIVWEDYASTAHADIVDVDLLDPDTGMPAMRFRVATFDLLAFSGWTVRDYPLISIPETFDPDVVAFALGTSGLYTAGGWVFADFSPTVNDGTPFAPGDVPTDTGMYVLKRAINDYASAWEVIGYTPQYPYLDNGDGTYLWTVVNLSKAFVTATGRIVVMGLGGLDVRDGSEVSVVWYSDDGGGSFTQVNGFENYNSGTAGIDNTYGFANEDGTAIWQHSDTGSHGTETRWSRTTDGLAYTFGDIRVAGGEWYGPNGWYVNHSGKVAGGGKLNGVGTVTTFLGEPYHANLAALGTTDFDDFVGLDIPEAVTSDGQRLIVSHWYYDHDGIRWIGYSNMTLLDFSGHEQYLVVLDPDGAFLNLVDLPSAPDPIFPTQTEAFVAMGSIPSVYATHGWYWSF